MKKFHPLILRSFFFIFISFFSFTWLGAQSISLNPNSGKQGTSFGVTVTGSGTNFLTSTTTCAQIYASPNTLDLTGISVSGNSTLTGNLNIPLGTNPGTYNARVYQGPGCAGTQYNCTNCFTVTPCDSTFKEDFQSETIPAAWGNLDLDMNTDANGRPMNWHVTADAQTTTPGDTNWVVAASSWFTPFGKADNWLIIGPVCIKSTDAILKWKSAPFEGPAFADGYQVRISTTDNNPTSFTDTLASFAEDIGGGTGTWGPGIQHPTFNGNNGVLAPWQFSLADYVGQSIYIAFHHDSNDDNLIMLDDIELTAIQVVDAAITEAVWPSEYYFAPLGQIRSCPLNLGCTVENVGDVDITNVHACCRIYRGTDLLENILSDTITVMAVNEIGGLSFPDPFYAIAEGIYTFEYIVKIEENDTITSNDTLTRTLIVNETTMSRDNNVVTSALSIGPGNTGILGQNFYLKQDDSLFAADLYLTGPTLGDSFSIVIYTANSITGQPQNLILETPVRFITMDDIQNPKIIRVPFPSPLYLPAGAFFIGVRESIANSITLGTSENIFTPSTTWVFLNSTWNTSETFDFSISYVLRPIFGACKDSLSLAGIIPGYESNISYHASWNINSTDIIQTGATDIYYNSGGTIDLWPGFTVENGATWQTLSDGCVELISQKLQSVEDDPFQLIIENPTNNSIISMDQAGDATKNTNYFNRGH